MTDARLKKTPSGYWEVSSDSAAQSQAANPFAQEPSSSTPDASSQAANPFAQESPPECPSAATSAGSNELQQTPSGYWVVSPRKGSQNSFRAIQERMAATERVVAKSQSDTDPQQQTPSPRQPATPHICLLLLVIYRYVRLYSSLGLEMFVRMCGCLVNVLVGVCCWGLMFF